MILLNVLKVISDVRRLSSTYLAHINLGGELPGGGAVGREDRRAVTWTDNTALQVQVTTRLSILH